MHCLCEFGGEFTSEPTAVRAQGWQYMSLCSHIFVQCCEYGSGQVRISERSLIVRWDAADKAVLFGRMGHSHQTYYGFEVLGIFFRIQLHPTKGDNTEILYTKFFTSLNIRQLLPNKDAGPGARGIPRNWV